MTWTGWLALLASQVAVLWISLFLLFRDLPNSLFVFEKLICAVLGVGLIAVDAAVLLGYVGPGWPVPARGSLAVLAAAVAVWLLNDAVYLFVKGADDPYPWLFRGYDVKAHHWRRIVLRLIGVALAVRAAFWLMPPG
jgi:hypothetical protein